MLASLEAKVLKGADNHEKSVVGSFYFDIVCCCRYGLDHLQQAPAASVVCSHVYPDAGPGKRRPECNRPGF
jgi:hypothetical protein